MTGADVEAVVAGVNRYLEGHQLYPRQTASTLDRLSRSDIDRCDPPVPRRRGCGRHDPRRHGGHGTVQDHGGPHRARAPAAGIAGSVVPVIPPGGVLKTAELSLLWHAPGRLDAGRFLWDAIRYEWRDQATHFAGEADHRWGSSTSCVSVRRLFPASRS